MTHQEAAIIEFRSYASMSKKDRRKKRQRGRPSLPRAITGAVKTAAPAESEGIDRVRLALKVNEDIDASLDHAGKVTRAMRWDVFELFRIRTPDNAFEASYNAVRRLQADIAAVHRTTGSTGLGGAPDPLQAWLADIVSDFSISRLQAAKRIYGTDREVGVLNAVEPWAAKLLLALCIPEIVEGRRVNWHDTVKRLTGENDRLKRAEIVRQACGDLAAAYRALDNEPKRGAA